MKILIFALADKEYAIDINQVREVIRMRQPVPVPEAADFVDGVISLRGKVTTLINLRRKLGLDGSGPARSSRIIIVSIDNHLLGMVVDSVNDVVNIDEAHITAGDESLKDASYLAGIVRIAKRIILLIDVEKLLNGEDRSGIGSVSARVEVRKKS